MCTPRSLVQTVVAYILGMLWLQCGQALAQSSQLQQHAQAFRVDITIKVREFHPSAISVSVGQPAVLVFTNQDVELHAFVPQRFLENVPFHLDGNGAPQFGEKGLDDPIRRPRGDTRCAEDGRHVRVSLRFTRASDDGDDRGRGASDSQTD